MGAIGELAVIVAAALAALAAAALLWRARRCQHRFGLPVSEHVRCMKCYRRFRIEATASGEWRIARHPDQEG